LAGQLLIEGVARHGGLNGGQFLGGNIPGVVFAPLPMLELVVGAGVLPTILKGIGAERAPLHGGNGGDLLQQACFIWWIHNVPISIGTQTKKHKPYFSV
jgi:hypothetical protein